MLIDDRSNTIYGIQLGRADEILNKIRELFYVCDLDETFESA